MIVAGFVAISVAYGFLIQRERIIVTMVATYVGIFISDLLGSEVAAFFHGDNPLFGKYFIHANIAEPNIRIALFVLVFFFVGYRSGIDVKGQSWLSPLEMLVLSALTGLLIAITILLYMPGAQQATIAANSHVATVLLAHTKLCIIAPLLALVGLGSLKQKLLG